MKFAARLSNTLMAGMRRFPEVMVVCWICMVVCILAAHGRIVANFGHLIATIALGIPLALAIKLSVERFCPGQWYVRLVLDIAGIGILAAYYCLFVPGYESPLRNAAFMLALIALCVVMPYCRRNDKFELFLFQLLTRGIVTVAYWLVISLGLTTIVTLIKVLFFQAMSVSILDAWIVSAGLFLPAFFCAGIPRSPAELAIQNTPKWWYTYLSYIALPLLAIYTTLLYAYFAKILVSQQWPEGMVAPFVLWYALKVTAILILTYPYRQQHPWLKRFAVFAPRLLLPLLGMMFIAIGMRIQAYGVTESRYAVVAAGVFMTGCMVYYIAAKTVKNTIIVSVAAALTFLSVVGPWSCFALSNYSQAQRFQALLIKNHLLQDGKLRKADPSLTENDKHELRAIIGYFQRQDQLPELPYLPPNSTPQRIYEALGLSESFKAGFYHVHTQAAATVVRGMDYFVDAGSVNGEITLDPASKLVFAYDAASHALKITKAGQVLYSKDVSELAAKIHLEANGRVTLDRGEMMFTDENRYVIVHYDFTAIYGVTDASGNVKFDNTPFQLAIKFK